MEGSCPVLHTSSVMIRGVVSGKSAVVKVSNATSSTMYQFPGSAFDVRTVSVYLFADDQLESHKQLSQVLHHCVDQQLVVLEPQYFG